MFKKAPGAKKTAYDGRESSPSDHDNKSAARKTNSQSATSDPGSNSEGYKPKISLPSHVECTYYIAGSNGNAIVEQVMNDLGWRRLKEKTDETFTLKWCEVKQSINYLAFKEGEQLVNRIPNCTVLTNKLGLINSLQEYNRVSNAMKKKTASKLDFVPDTFRLDDVKDRESFRDAWKEGEVWICKPTGRNQGKGIYLVKNKEEVNQLFQEQDERNQLVNGKIVKPANKIIQRYIHNPLLINNKKFDIRAYMLIANTTPYLVLYHKGYIRLSMFDYENKFDNLAMHLTNQFIQKKDPMYKDMKEDTVWSMEKFNDYINDTVTNDKGIEKDWVNLVLPVKMQQIMMYCFTAVKHRLQCKVGFFDLYGFDFMIDDDMKVWLIEVNVNPALAVNCGTLKDVLPPMVKETLYLAIECFEKSRRGRSLMPIQSLNNFQVLFNGCTKVPKARHGSPSRAQQSNTTQQQRSRSLSPVRRPRSFSPTKDIAQSTDNQNRRGLMSLRPGMKPSPTSVHMGISKPGAGGGPSTLQAGSSGNRSGGGPTTSQIGSTGNRPGGGAPTSQIGSSGNRSGGPSMPPVQKSPYATDKNFISKTAPKYQTISKSLQTNNTSKSTNEKTSVKVTPPSPAKDAVDAERGKAGKTGDSDQAKVQKVPNRDKEDVVEESTNQGKHKKTNQPDKEKTPDAKTPEKSQSVSLDVKDSGVPSKSLAEKKSVVVNQEGAAPKSVKSESKVPQGTTPRGEHARSPPDSQRNSTTDKHMSPYLKTISTKQSPKASPRVTASSGKQTSPKSTARIETKPGNSSNNNNGAKSSREAKTQKQSVTNVSLRMTSVNSHKKPPGPASAEEKEHRGS